MSVRCYRNPSFGRFPPLRETEKPTALNPTTGEKLAGKVGAVVRLKVAPGWSPRGSP